MTTGDSDIPPIPSPPPVTSPSDYQAGGYQPGAYQPAAYQPAAYQPAAYQQGEPTPARPQGLALASLICGIAGVVLSFAALGLFPSIAAVITGHLAQKRQPWGRGLWLGGLITGYVGILFALIGGVIIALIIGLVLSHGGGYSTFNNGGYSNGGYSNGGYNA